MPHFLLVTQFPKPKTLGEGRLSIGKDGDADFFEGDASAESRLLASIVRVQIRWAAAGGILLSGMEPDGVDKSGRQKYKSQEWWLCYLKPTNKAQD